jgi:hypothetical protein
MDAAADIPVDLAGSVVRYSWILIRIPRYFSEEE